MGKSSEDLFSKLKERFTANKKKSILNNLWRNFLRNELKALLFTFNFCALKKKWKISCIMGLTI